MFDCLSPVEHQKYQLNDMRICSDFSCHKGKADTQNRRVRIWSQPKAKVSWQITVVGNEVMLLVIIKQVCTLTKVTTDSVTIETKQLL